MTLSKGTLIALVLLLVNAGTAWSLSEARLLGMSRSGQTALFNLGVHDGVVEGDFAVVVKEIRDLESRNLRIVPVAKAKNIKVSTQNSVWIMYRMFDAELLVKGQKFLLLTESQMLSGRRDRRFGRIQVVTQKDKVSYQTQQTLSEDKERLAKLSQIYPEIEQLHKKEPRNDLDGDLVDVSTWKSFNREKYPTALYKSPHEFDFRRELRLSTFEKIVTAYLLKVNEPKFNYDKFYDEQMKEAFAQEFRKRSNFSTEYEKFLSTQAKKAVADAKIYRSILDKGGSWSEDFSDEELKVILSEVSVLQEKDRRVYVSADPKRFSIFLGYGLSFTDAQTPRDPGYRRDGRYSVEFDFEGTPFLKHETLERFTLFAGARINRTATESNGINARVNEASFRAGLNWYPLYPPHALEAPAIFLGTFIRSGLASLEAPTVDEISNYTVLVMPGFWGGLKYNFRNKIGLRIALSLETLNLDRYEQSTFEATLPDRATLVEGKMNFALAYSF